MHGGGDWIAFYRVGDRMSQGSKRAYRPWFAHLCGDTSGKWTLSAPTQPGEYEFRYMVEACRRTKQPGDGQCLCVSVDPRCAHVKGDEQRPDVDGISVGELDRRGDALAAAPRAVLAAEILEHRAFGRYHEPRMTTGHRRRVEPDFHIGIASDDVFADERGKRRSPHSSQHAGRSEPRLERSRSVMASPQNA